MRFIATLKDEKNYQYFIGKFNDECGCSIKFFINEKNECEKIVFIDDQVASITKFITSIDFKNLLNWETHTDNDINHLLDKLIDDSLN